MILVFTQEAFQGNMRLIKANAKICNFNVRKCKTTSVNSRNFFAMGRVKLVFTENPIMCRISRKIALFEI